MAAGPPITIEMPGSDLQVALTPPNPEQLNGLLPVDEAVTNRLAVYMRQMLRQSSADELRRNVLESDTNVTWQIELDGQPIGVRGLNITHPRLPESFGAIYLPSHHNKQIGRATIIGAAAFAFARYDAALGIKTYVQHNNLASVRMCSAVGFQQYGESREELEGEPYHWREFCLPNPYQPDSQSLRAEVPALSESQYQAGTAGFQTALRQFPVHIHP